MLTRRGKDKANKCSYINIIYIYCIAIQFQIKKYNNNNNNDKCCINYYNIINIKEFININIINLLLYFK